MNKKSEAVYSDAEAEKRLQAALRGSRVTGHKPMADIPKKRAVKKPKTKKASK